MNIFNDEQLYQYFKDAIERATSNDIKELEMELKTLRNDVYKQLNLSFEQRKNIAVKTIDVNLDLEYQKHLSRLEQNLNRLLSQYREELLSSLIHKLRMKFFEFQQTQAYVSQLEAKLSKYDESKVSLIEISKDDYSKIKLKSKIKVVVNNDITAGYRAYYVGGKIVVDETLETKIINAKNWFYQNAELNISQFQDEVKA